MVVPPRVWRPLGGHLAIDLCNTVSRRFAPPAEYLDRITTVPELVAWYALAVPDTAPLRQVTAHDLALVRELRDATTAILDAHVSGERIPSGALEVVLAAYREFTSTATASDVLPLVLAPGGTGGALARRTLSAAVTDLLRNADATRLRRCEGDGCGWFFLDQTRNHSRRWCDSTDCGNRHRVRAYASRLSARKDG